MKRLSGAYALCVLIGGETEIIFATRNGPPLVIGYGDGEMFVGSDALAVGPFTNRVLYLEDGDYAMVDHDGARLFDARARSAKRPIKQVASSAALMEKGNYRHFMEKEIHDQPEGCQRTIAAYVDTPSGRGRRAACGIDWASWSASRSWPAAPPTSAPGSSASHYDREIRRPAGGRRSPLSSATASRRSGLDALVIAMSQSGETADTLAALRYCKDKGMRSAVVVNAVESTMAREVDVVWPIRCGSRVGGLDPRRSPPRSAS